MHGLSAYGHSWIAGDGASHPARTLVHRAGILLDVVPQNCGAGGSLSTDTARLVTEMPPAPAEIYVLMTGLNDVRLYGEDMAASRRYGDALETIFGAFRAAHPGSVVIAVEQPHLNDFTGFPPHNAGSNELVDRFNTVLRRSAAACGARVASVTGWDADTMLSDDAVHPNDKGHAVLAECLASVAVPQAM